MIPTIERVEACPRCNHAFDSAYHKGYCGEERTPPTGFVYDAILADSILYDPATQYLGSDWSHWNEVNVKKATELGIKFVYIKITEGTNFLDDKSARYFDLCGQYGIKRSFYHYLRCGVNGYAQADWMLNKIGGRVPDLPIALDAEDPNAKKYSKKSNANNIYKFAKRCQGFAGWPEIMIYTRATWWNPYVAYSYNWHLLSLWVAHWGAGGNPSLPEPWRKNKVPWTIHQYGMRKIGGATVDANKWNPAVPFPGDETPPIEPPEPPEPPEPTPTIPDEFSMKGAVKIYDENFKFSAVVQKDDDK